MAVTVKEICDNVTLGREMSMLGNYESAEVYYEGTIQMLNRFIITISEPTRKDKWQQVSTSIYAIYSIINKVKVALYLSRYKGKLLTSMNN